MNSLDTAAEISSTKEEQLRKMVFAGIFAAIPDSHDCRR